MPYPTVLFGELKLCAFLYFTILHVVRSMHFRGGTITWAPVNTSQTSSSTVDIIIEQSYSWKRSSHLTDYCDASTIATNGLIGDSSYLECLTIPNCGGFLSGNLSTQVVCTDYSANVDMSTGRISNIVKLNNGSQLTIGYNSSAWLPLQTVPSGSWSIITAINLQLRTDNGRLNTPPITNFLPVINVPINIQRTIIIPMLDVDGDYLRCRWSKSSPIDECGSVCSAVPGATLNGNSTCTLTFTGTSVGYYAAALQVEDFYMSTSNISSPLSSVPAQFLINVINITCWPTIIGLQQNGAMIYVLVNTLVIETVIAETGCLGTTITDFLETSPSGMITSSVTQNPLNSSLYSITLNWIPTTLGSQVFCCAALESNQGESDQYCLTFVVGAVTTTTTTTTTVVTSITMTTLPYGLSTLDIGLITGMSLLGLLCCCSCCCWWCSRQLWKRRKEKMKVHHQQDISSISNDSTERNPYLINSNRSSFICNVCGVGSGSSRRAATMLNGSFESGLGSVSTTTANGITQPHSSRPVKFPVRDNTTNDFNVIQLQSLPPQPKSSSSPTPTQIFTTGNNSPVMQSISPRPSGISIVKLQQQRKRWYDY
ncbi:unnamed protein product [Didymodactylos carnosus]|uniref:Uncharacterized protein n=1 Tax=Didymodactylos carnosus TaxID=1234261 RepID=A0A814D2N9_9BILA|nr:unnamed protein product [Didymodactylos carnosus]CAF0948657.1 unnamed protein product [Didymodactylos carnosus]CAF3668151.1 unnamed protein product [Didymodactylos carnosus]CAF3724561.1 unnamed protein product [Didymodactylos carnosus]